MVATTTDPMLLTVEEVARRLGIGRSLAWRLVRSGELPSVRLGRLVRVPERKLQAWLDRQSDEGDRWAVVPRRTRRR